MEMLQRDRCFRGRDNGDPVRVRLVQVSSPRHYALWNALSVDTLAGDLRGEFREEVDVSVGRIRSDSDIERFLRSLTPRPHVIGISAELGSLEWTVQLVRAIRSLGFPAGQRPLIVLGNILPTCLPGRFLDEDPQAIIVRGEGEEALREIVRYVKGGTTLDRIPSLVYRDENGKTTTTPRRPPVLATLVHPPALDTVAEVLRHDGNVLIETSRGCPWSRCAYCAVRASRNGKRWEALPPERILANIDQLMAAGVRELEFADADLLGGIDEKHLNRVRWLCDTLRELQARHNKKLSFRAFLTPQIFCRAGQLEVSDGVKDVLLALKGAGMTRVYIGVESGCDSQLRRYRRSTTPAQLEYAIRLLRDEIGVGIDVGFLMFDPDLTLDEMLENVSFFERLDLFDANQWPFRPIRLVPETPMCKRMRKEGRLGRFDLDQLAYTYAFKDHRVQKIYDIIDCLSAETRDIFYAVKVVSKLRFEGREGWPETSFADKMVKGNARIYLDLMRSLAEAIKAESTDLPAIVDRAKRRIEGLMEKILHEVQDGSLQEHAEFLTPRLSEHHAHDEREKGTEPRQSLRERA